jgi:membrane-anchored protein YejM (alkaline phosphatase superfamily)
MCPSGAVADFGMYRLPNGTLRRWKERLMSLGDCKMQIELGHVRCHFAFFNIQFAIILALRTFSPAQGSATTLVSVYYLPSLFTSRADFRFFSDCFGSFLTSGSK